MIISAVAVSPKIIVLGETVDIIVLIEGADPDGIVEVCVSVAWPFEIDGRAMLCQTGLGSPVSVAFRTTITGKAMAQTCQITVLAGSDDGQNCSAIEKAEVHPEHRSRE